jgi:hypothetical protein
LRELTAHDAEDIRDDVRFAILSEKRDHFRRPMALWNAVSKALDDSDIDVRYAAYSHFEIARNGLDSERRQPLDAFAQTLGFNLSVYERTKADQVRTALVAAEMLRDALRLSSGDLYIVAEILLKYGVDPTPLRRVPKTLAEALGPLEDRL